MSDPRRAKDSAVSTRTMEIIVAAITLLLGVLVVYDSVRLGRGWDDDGPKSGYFPFYIGLLIVVGSAVNAYKAFADGGGSFVGRQAARDVLTVLIPTAVYVAIMQVLGLYVASALYIAVFMWRLGKYSWAKTIPVAIGVPVVFFCMFELWFGVPLLKGPLEAALGLN